MSKKQKKVNAQTSLTESQSQDEISQGVVDSVADVNADANANDKSVENKSKQDKVQAKNSKQDKNVKDKKKDKKKEKKGGFVKKTKETASELKKVTWPSFAEVVKKTSIVIAFVIIFGLFLFAVNFFLGWLVDLLVIG